MDNKSLIFIRIQKRIEEVEKEGKGKIVIFIEKHKIKEWQTIKEEKIDKDK